MDESNDGVEVVYRACFLRSLYYILSPIFCSTLHGGTIIKTMSIFSSFNDKLQYIVCLYNIKHIQYLKIK